jgi:hypothetical protein
MSCALQATITPYLCLSEVEEPNRVEVACLIHARFLGRLWTHEPVVRAALIFSMCVPCCHQDIQPLTIIFRALKYMITGPDHTWTCPSKLSSRLTRTKWSLYDKNLMDTHRCAVNIECTGTPHGVQIMNGADQRVCWTSAFLLQDVASWKL